MEVTNAKTEKRFVFDLGYDDVKRKVEQLIAEATAKDMLESDADNEYTREIAELSRLMAAYEDL